MQEPLLTEDSYLFAPSRPWPSEPVRPALDRAWNGFLVPDSRLPHVNEAWTILEVAAMQFKPKDIFLLFSGGYDSLIASHLSMQLLDDTFRKYASHFGDERPNVHVLHINTGIGIPETQDYVRSVAVGFHWHYLEYTTPERYEASVLKYGFPGPAQHFRMYSRLKERALRLAIRDHTPPHPLDIHRQELYDLLNGMHSLPLRYQYALVRLIRRYLTEAIRTYRREQLRPILFVTGVRRLESARRMGNVVPMQKQGRHWWLSPLTSWSKDHVLDYRDAYQLPRNNVADLLHKSGECLCGSFAKAGELEEIACFFPQVGQYIKDLEKRVWRAGFHWGWEEGPPKRKGKLRRNQSQLVLPGFEDALVEEKEEEVPLTGFSPLCSSCNARFEQEHFHTRSAQNTGSSIVV